MPASRRCAKCSAPSFRAVARACSSHNSGCASAIVATVWWLAGLAVLAVHAATPPTNGISVRLVAGCQRLQRALMGATGRDEPARPIAGAVAVPPSYGAAERARRSCKPTVAADPCILVLYRSAARARRGGAGPRGGGTRYACLARGAPAPNRSSTCVLRLGRLAAVC